MAELSPATTRATEAYYAQAGAAVLTAADLCDWLASLSAARRARG